jgi:arabinosyltransferase C
VKGLPRWFWWVTAAALFATSLPYHFALAIQPEDTLYLGVHSNYDDHAVYASWTKQAQEGRFFFENRFTTDDQPGKTINLYFLAAGWVAKAVGIPVALHLFRVVFGFLALFALYRLVVTGVSDESSRMPAFLFGIVSMGLGFLFWRSYGFDGPIDVWQPEAFLVPSLIQNGLFCGAIWLILVTWRSLLSCQHSWHPVLPGAAAILVLTNIHTYDTLLIAIVCAGFLAAMIGAKSFSLPWLGRAAVIACGAIPSVAWFMYVRSIDPVFAARADTVTISAPAYWVVLGLIPGLIFAGFGLARNGSKAAVYGAAALLVVIIGAQAVGQYGTNALWLSTPSWALLAFCGIVLCAVYKPKAPFYGFLFSWIVMGILALYYPGLFQRKLAMVLALPVGIGAGLGIAHLPIEQRKMKPAMVLSAAILGLSGIFWIAREAMMPVKNLSNTTMQRVYWPSEVAEFMSYFHNNAGPGDALIAIPGVAVPDDFENPTDYQLAIPDLNAVMSGWGGIKTYAGHWSETPNYVERRQRVMSDLFSPNTTRETAYTLMTDAHANYIIAPKTEIARQAGVPDPQFYASLGEIVFEGDEWLLVRFRPSP